MQTSNNERMLGSSASSQIAPAYSKAMAQTAQHYKLMLAFVSAQMQKDIDYGIIPGTKKPTFKKPTLLKAGSEKLCRLFNLRPHLELLHSVVDFDKPLFYFHYVRFVPTKSSLEEGCRASVK